MKKKLQIMACVAALGVAVPAAASTFTFRNTTGKPLTIEVTSKLTILGLKQVTETYMIPDEGEVQLKELGYCLKKVRIGVPNQEILDAPIQGFTPQERAKVNEALANMATTLGSAGKSIGDALGGLDDYATYGTVLKIAAQIGVLLYKKAKVPDVCKSQHFEIILNYDETTKQWQPFVTYIKL